MREFSSNITYLNQVDFFEELMTNGNIDKKYFLQDGLHLNKQGYIVLNKLLKSELQILKV
jgi:lysophospholipase L1-like esterase